MKDNTETRGGSFRRLFSGLPYVLGAICLGRGNLACPCFIVVFGGPHCVLLWRMNRARTGLGDLDLTAGSSPRSKEVEVGPSRAELRQLGGAVGAEQLGERKVENRDVLW